ncbi:MAG TPA: HIT family protein [Candidatus Saccharimonadales bacterium]|nr:HIT family protein [Candidatus Saccharimonadales bacterium]
MQESIFTKIVKGEIPCHKVYEDDATLAFLDIHPIQPGQVLVIPKKEVPYVWDMDDELYSAVMATAKKVAQQLRGAFPDRKFVAMHIEGLDIEHAHIKLFPFNTDTEFHNKPDMTAEPDHAALAEMAKRLAF